ncbi:hypothetical protein GW756_04175 [bacterium]|nr:hypothetical protein [bacterium]NCQ55202.1 hypothetical protein [Candidatus Parcubacteria bacterium]NCS67285.1 hypothetical protein [Candidatus Peregrinibacteria bacterium]NCS96540.1 hypothetical protein [bacterium]
MEFDRGILQILQPLIHYSLHLLLPGIIAWIFYRKICLTAWAVMAATMLVDIDHLLAEPIFEASRCSIGFHPLHTIYAMGFYLFIFFVPNVYFRLIGLGLLLHMATDFQDCLWISAR